MRSLLVLFTVLLVLRQGGAAVQKPEHLLPADTLLMVAVPDAGLARKLLAASRYGALWNDPAMRPFREKYLHGWKTEFLTPFERELDFSFAEFSDLIEGQVTFAVTPSRSKADPGAGLGFLLLADAKDKSSELQAHLERLRQRWSENSSRSFRTEEFRGIQFSVLSFATNELPVTIGRFFPGPLDYQEIGQEPPKPSSRKTEMFFGRVGSVLLVANSLSTLEGPVDRLTGGASPTLAEQQAFQSHQLRLFREVPFYAWLNAKPIFDLLVAKSTRQENPLAPNPFELIQPAKLLAASGLGGVQSLGFSARPSEEGTHLEFMVAVPENSRAGIFRVLAGEPKEASIPAFVPADVVKFQRWRIDGQKAWTSFEKMLTEAAPQAINSLNFIIDTANLAARQKNPGFDLRKALIGNLGDDFVLYEKAAREGQPGDPSEGPKLYLIGSPNPEVFAASVQNILILVTAHAGSPQEREFLGRKIFSVPIPPLNLGFEASPAPARARTLHYAGGPGYVAFSTEAGLVEEFLRSSDQAGKNLRDVTGLLQAAEKVLVPGSSYFRYEDSQQSLRPAWESLRKGSSTPDSVGTLRTMDNIPGMKSPEKRFTEWLDFSLLPPFASISKYLHFSVIGNKTTVDGLSYTLFAPAPAGLGSTPQP